MAPGLSSGGSEEGLYTSGMTFLDTCQKGTEGKNGGVGEGRLLVGNGLSFSDSEGPWEVRICTCMP